MVGPDPGVSIMGQCVLLAVARSTVYYHPVPVPIEDLELMARIDRIHLEHPFLGSRRITDVLRDDGFGVNRKRVQRLMRVIGIEALYPKKRTSTPAPGT